MGVFMWVGGWGWENDVFVTVRLKRGKVGRLSVSSGRKCGAFNNKGIENTGYSQLEQQQLIGIGVACDRDPHLDLDMPWVVVVG